MDRSASRMRSRERTERGVSIAVTHVLTIAITTLLISALMFSAGSMLDTERERGAEDSLETIGERLAKEVSAVNRSGTENASMYVEHPRRVSGSTYSVELRDQSDCDGPLVEDIDGPCVYLRAHDENVDVYAPLGPVAVANDATATGGPMVIETDASGNVTIRSERR